MQEKLGHTSSLKCLTALLFPPCHDCRLVCSIQAKFGHCYIEFPDGVCCPILFHQHAFMHTREAWVHLYFELPDGAVFFLFSLIKPACLHSCARHVFVEEPAVHVAMATPQCLESQCLESLNSLHLHEKQPMLLLVDHSSLEGPQVVCC